MTVRAYPARKVAKPRVTAKARLLAHCDHPRRNVSAAVQLAAWRAKTRRLLALALRRARREPERAQQVVATPLSMAAPTTSATAP